MVTVITRMTGVAGVAGMTRITGTAISVLTRPRPCGIPARKTEMVHYNQEDAPVRAQGQATSQKDLSSFNGQPDTKAFCLFE